MRDYIKEAKNITKDIYLDKLRHFLLLFTTHSSFEDFLGDMKRSNNAIVLRRNELSSISNIEDYLIIDYKMYKIYKLIHEKKLSTKSGLIMGNPSENTLQDIYLRILSLNEIYRENCAFSKNINDEVVLYPIYSLGFSIHDYINIMCLDNPNINLFVDYLKNHNHIHSVNKELLEELKKLFSQYMSINELQPLEEQIKIIDAIVQNSLIKILGVPGASKTFTNAIAIIITILHDKLHQALEEINWLVTGVTYRSVEESFKNIYNILTSQVFHDFLKDEKITVKLIFLHSKSRSKNYEQYKQNFISTPNVIVNFGPDLKIGEEKIRIVFTPISRFQKYSQPGSIYMAQNCSESDIYNVFENMYTLPIGDNKTYKIPFNGITIEESSQFSPVKFFLIINSFIKNIFPIQDAITEKDIENEVKKRRLRISFSGDPKQLSPIYEYIDYGINFLRIGDFYNMFSFFNDDSIPTLHLTTSLRVPRKILHFSHILYEKITPHKETRDKDIFPIAKDDFAKLIEKIAINSHIGRIRYKIVTNKKFIKNLPTKENEIESIICEKIYQIYKEPLENNNELSFFLSPYRAQERLNISKGIKEVGTVDKTQGNEGWLIVYSMTSMDQIFIEENLGFLTVPNRINVALTRAKGLFILIHSYDFESAIWTGIPKLDKLAIEDFIFSYYKNTGKKLTKLKALELLPEFDLNKGMYILQQYLSEVSHSVGKIYLPIEIRDEIISLDKSFEFTRDIPEGDYIEADFYISNNTL